MKDYLRDRLALLGIDQSIIEQYDERITAGELSDGDIARFVRMFEAVNLDDLGDALKELRENAELIPSNSEGWHVIQGRLFEIIDKNRTEALERESLLAEMYKRTNATKEAIKAISERFPEGSIDEIERDAQKFKESLLQDLTDGEESVEKLKNGIDDLARQTDALSVMYTYARLKETQLMATEYLVTVAEPVREFLGRQHEHFKDTARDVSEYARDILDRTKEIPKHIAYGSIAERARLSDAKFTPVIDAKERHHAKAVSKAIRRYEEALKDREEFVRKRATREEERLRAQYRRDVEKWYRDASRGKPKEERDDLRQQKENLINARYSAIPEEAKRSVEDSHKRILARMDKVVEKHRAAYEGAIQKVAQDIVNIRQRAEKEREHLDSLLREGKISVNQYKKYIEQVDKIDYSEEQRFSKDVKKFLEQDKGNLGRTMLEEKINGIEQQYEAEMTENVESIEQVVEQGEPVVENDVPVQDVNDVVIEEPDESLSQDEPDVVQEEEPVIGDDGAMVFTPEETGFSLDQIIDSEDQEFVPAEKDEFEWVNGYEIE